MWMSLRQEGNKRKAVHVDKALVLDSGNNWRNRLHRLVSFPGKKEAYRFMANYVNPALEDVASELEKKGLTIKLLKEDDRLELEVLHGEEVDFFYQVRLVKAIKPVFALGQSANISAIHDEDMYYRAEVFLAEGSQDYDILGCTKEQIIIDVLNQYERHMQFLHFER